MAFRPKLAVSTLNSRHSFMAGDQTRIIGVLDLLDGAVVHAVAGQRATYLPIASRICDSSQADQVAQALAASFDIREFYIADLNAIAGGEGNWRSIQAVAAQSDRLWLDLGIGQATKVLALRHRLSQLQRHSAAMTLIIGLESVASQHELPRLLSALRANFPAGHDTTSFSLAFSLDLRQGQPITSVPEWQRAKVITIAQEVCQLGICKFVVLDLAAVGNRSGCTTMGLCRELRNLSPELEIVTGGGIRDRADLERLAEAGCDGALVASALHSGTMSAPNPGQNLNP